MRKRFLLPCDCGKKLIVDATQAGEQLSCECGASLAVPTLRGLESLERLDEPAEASASSRRPSSAHPSRMLGSDLAFAGFLFLLILSVVALIPLVLIWLRLDTSFDMETDLLYGEQQIDMISVDESWQLWLEFRNNGLQVGEVPFYTRILQYSNVFSRVILGLSIVLAISLIGLIISGRVSAKARSARRAAHPT
jgi:hypothetical protein